MKIVVGDSGKERPFVRIISFLFLILSIKLNLNVPISASVFTMHNSIKSTKTNKKKPTVVMCRCEMT